MSTEEEYEEKERKGVSISHEEPERKRLEHQAERLKSTVELQTAVPLIRQFIPVLSASLAKGHCGKVGVIGGCKEYTGAPYFAAITALKIGADLVYVFCSEDASVIIKSYSPELIVIPLLKDKDVLKKIEPWLARLNVLVIGPGLGRDPDLLRNVTDIIKHIGKKYKTPLIFDADGLYMVSENPNLLENYKGPKILTPNKNEFNKLISKIKANNALEAAIAFNAVVVQKGSVDVITNGMYYTDLELSPRDTVIKCDTPGSFRRCGGQGDVLAGCIATFTAWFEISKVGSEEQDIESVKLKSPQKKHLWFMENAFGYSLAAYAACCVVKQCSKFTFQKYGRGMVASDMINNLYKSFKTLFHE